jgi:hypothetical protein
VAVEVVAVEAVAADAAEAMGVEVVYGGCGGAAEAEVAAEVAAEAPDEPSATAIRSKPPLLPRRGVTLHRATGVGPTAAAEAGAAADTDAGSAAAPAGVLGVRGDLGVCSPSLRRELPGERGLSCARSSPSELPRSRERSRSPAESSEPGTTAPAGTTVGLRGEERCSCHGPFPRAAAGSGGGGGGSLVRAAGGSLIGRHGWSCSRLVGLDRWLGRGSGSNKGGNRGPGIRTSCA